jgi:hypothetical protein
MHLYSMAPPFGRNPPIGKSELVSLLAFHATHGFCLVAIGESLNFVEENQVSRVGFFMGKFSIKRSCPVCTHYSS